MSSPAGDGVDSRAAATVVLFLGVVGLLIAVATVLASALPTDPGPVSAESLRQFVYPPQDIRPEPTERRVFLTSLVLLPVFALAGAWVVTRKVARWRTDLVALALPIVAGALLVLLGNERALEVVRSANGPWWLLLAAAVAGGLIVVSTRNAPLLVGDNRATRVSVVMVTAFAVWCAFSWRTLDVRALDAIARYDIHLDAVLYSVVQAVDGRVPLADFTTQYGFFGVALAPWFRVVGLSVLSLTLTLNFLYWASLAAIVAFAFRQFRQLPLAIGVCLTLFYLVNSWSALTGDPDPYFQYAPLRLLFPALSMMFVAQWLKQPSVRGTVLISLLSGVALVWQLDSGVAVAGAWLLLLSYQTLAAIWAQQDWRASLRMVALAVAGVALPVLAFMAWVRLSAGAPVDFGVATESSRLYYGSGFYMLPMPTDAHPWMIVAAILGFGITVGSLRVVGYFADGRSWTLLHLALLGFGLFPYYQGRSHDRVLIYVAWPAVMIAFLVADRAWTLAQTNRLRPAVGVGIAAPVLTLGVLSALLLAADVPATLRIVQDRARGYVAAPWVQKCVEFVRTSTRGQSEAVILSRFQAVYLAEAGLASPLRGPGLVEVITRAQGDDVVHQIEQMKPQQIFLGPYYATDDDVNPFRSLAPLLAKDYAVTARTDGDELRLYTRRADSPR